MRRFGAAVLSAIRHVNRAGVGARVEHIEPDELVGMSETGVLNNALQLCRRCHDDLDQAVKRLRAIAGASCTRHPHH
jgi:hypothetical protein